MSLLISSFFSVVIIFSCHIRTPPMLLYSNIEGVLQMKKIKFGYLYHTFFKKCCIYYCNLDLFHSFTT